MGGVPLPWYRALASPAEGVTVHSPQQSIDLFHLLLYLSLEVGVEEIVLLVDEPVVRFCIPAAPLECSRQWCVRAAHQVERARHGRVRLFRLRFVIQAVR